MTRPRAGGPTQVTPRAATERERPRNSSSPNAVRDVRRPLPFGRGSWAFSLTPLALLLPLLLAADAPGPLAYTPPPPPAAADPLGLLLRLFGLTAAAVGVCGGLVWLVRKAGRPAAVDPGAAGRLVVESSLALDRKCSLHVLKVDGQAVAVTTDATGLRSLVLLAEPFDDHLDPAA